MNKQQQQHQLCGSCHNQEVHIGEHLTVALKGLEQRCSGTLKEIQASAQRYRKIRQYKHLINKCEAKILKTESFNVMQEMNGNKRKHRLELRKMHQQNSLLEV